MANERKVTQYDFSFNKIAEYKNVYHVLNSINATQIYDILKRTDRKAYGYFWSFSDVDVMHEKRVVLAVFADKAYENTFAFYNSIHEASIDTCIDERSIFSSMMNGTLEDGIAFIEYNETTQKVLELNKDFFIVKVHDKLSDAVKSSGLSANTISYMYRKNEALEAKFAGESTFIKLKQYVRLFTNYYEQ